jgi:lipopolysaccharide export system protein LptA
MTIRIDTLPALALAAALIATLSIAGPIRAADPPKDQAQPTHDQGTFEVTADRDLEWLQQDKAYVARGNAVAKRGTVTLMADLIVAYYRPLATPGAPLKPVAAPMPTKPGATPATGFDSGSTEIWRVVAEGNVHVISEDKDAWGDRGEYDKDKSVIVLTGEHLKGSTLEDIVTARDSLEYWEDQGMAVARGNAVIKKTNGNTLAGDLVGGHFVKDAHGQSVLKTVEAQGNVVVTTLTDIVHGDQGVYDIDAKRTVLFGNVRASRGANTLEGASAEVNMTTGISQVFPGAGQRVRGLFVHQSNSDQDQKKSSTGKKR